MELLLNRIDFTMGSRGEISIRLTRGTRSLEVIYLSEDSKARVSFRIDAEKIQCNCPELEGMAQIIIEGIEQKGEK